MASIDRRLGAAGWAVQDHARANLSATRGVAIREFALAAPHGRADYLLFVDGKAVGAIEAKKQGETLQGRRVADRQVPRRATGCATCRRWPAMGCGRPRGGRSPTWSSRWRRIGGGR